MDFDADIQLEPWPAFFLGSISGLRHRGQIACQKGGGAVEAGHPLLADYALILVIMKSMAASRSSRMLFSIH